ncbi:hypothetical protein ACWGLF_28960 [Streptomyces puniciscabiei]
MTAEPPVRPVQHLGTCNAGVVPALRTIADDCEALHGFLGGAVGCHVALIGAWTAAGSRH